MSQVTRCPACGTRFKVVADQLRISQGWVRCGVCHEVFDASEDLQPLPTAPVNAAGTPVAGGASHNPAEFEDDDIREFRESMWLPTAPSGLPGRGASGPAAPVAPSVPAAPAAPAAPAVSTATTAAAASAEPSPSMPPAEVPAPEAPPSPPVTAKDPSASAAEESGSALPGASLVDEILAASRAAPKSPPAAQAEQAVDGLLGPESDTAAPVPAPAKDEEGVPFTRPHKPSDKPSDKSSDKSSDAPAPSVPTGLLRESEPQAPASVPSPEFSRWPDSDGEGSGEAAAALPEAEPGFVRQARRKAFWRRPAVRVALVLGSLLGVGALAGQVMWGQRDALAVQHPSLAPALQALCAMAGCELQPRRQIGDVVIGSSGFRQLPRSGQYQWSLSLENRSDFPVAMPAVELTLTDAQDKLLLRRVIRLDQFGAPAQIEGHGEWSVTAPVEVQGLEAAVAGYRALVFYP